MIRYALLLGFLAFPILMLGQERDERSTLLPDIDPQDIEIRGDFRARFPGLSRQPILGFNPKPRVFQMDPDRMPYVESEEDIVASFSPEDLEQPYSPKVNRINYADQSRIFSRLGVGTYVSPEARIYGEIPTGEHSVVSGDFNLHSTKGHLADEFSSFRYLDGRADYILRKSTSRLQFGLNGRSDFNYAITDPQGNDMFRKNYKKIGAHSSYRHLNNAYNGWDLRTGYHYFQTDDHTGQDYSDEHYGRLSINRFWDGRRMEEVYSLELSGEGSIYNTFEEQNLSWYITRLNAFYKRELISSSFKAGLDAYHSHDEVADPVNLYIFPNVSFKYTGFRKGEVEASLKSFVENKGLEGVHLENRQLLIDPMIHNQQGLRAELTAQFDVFRGAQLFTDLKFDGYGNYAYYMLEDDGYSIHYDDDTDIFEATLGVNYDLIPQKITLTSDVILINSSTSENEPVPFLEKFRTSTSLYSNPISNLYLRAWTEYIGSRPVNFDDDNMESLDGYFLLGVQIDYKINNTFGAYIKGLNLLDQNYEVWRGYQERPAQIYGGITLHF
ncbi:MAG: TonB-dependent receptor [Balneolales bacterium]